MLLYGSTFLIYKKEFLPGEKSPTLVMNLNNSTTLLSISTENPQQPIWYVCQFIIIIVYQLQIGQFDCADVILLNTFVIRWP